MPLNTTQMLRERVQLIKSDIYSQVCLTEEEVRSRFIEVVRELLEHEGIPLTIEMERKLIRGRPDARIGAIIFEFERPLDERGRLREHVTKFKIEQ